MTTVPTGAAISLDLIGRIVGRKLTKVQRANATSLFVALNDYGAGVGLDQPHRLAQFMAQILHESGAFRYDREVWGPTPAQKRYDTRVDLGNTPQVDGDGRLRAGKGPLQLTGGFNEREFTEWAREKIDPAAPDFYAHPELINTDPWEGLSALWYWDTHGLNRYADSGDIEMVTKRINGGLNGYQDRLDWYAATALVLLGYGRSDVKGFQRAAGLKPDGVAGPRTRAAMHKALVALSAAPARSSDVQAAPVVEEKPVVPATVEHEVKKKTGRWGWAAGALTTAGAAVSKLFDADWTTAAVIIVGGIVVVVGVIILRKQLVGAVKDIRQAVEAG